MKTLVPTAFHESLDRCQKTKDNTVPPRRAESDHKVEIIPDVPLQKAQTYPLSYDADRWLKNRIDKSLAKRRIESTDHWFASPVYFVPKKTPGDFWMMTDYRQLNRATVKDAYPLPKISTCFKRIRMAEYFTKLDQLTSYQLLQMRPEDEK